MYRNPHPFHWEVLMTTLAELNHAHVILELLQIVHVLVTKFVLVTLERLVLVNLGLQLLPTQIQFVQVEQHVPVIRELLVLSRLRQHVHLEQLTVQLAV
jgi:hypothetical protein